MLRNTDLFLDILRHVEYHKIMGKGFANIFRPSKKGLGRAMGELEKTIMDILWQRHEATGKEVYEAIRRSREVALTTVLTVLDRLSNKGMVVKKKGESVYTYAPALTEAQFTDRLSQEVMRGILDISKSSAVASFVDILADTDPEELNRLSKLVEKKKKEMHGKKGVK